MAAFPSAQKLWGRCSPTEGIARGRSGWMDTQERRRRMPRRITPWKRRGEEKEKTVETGKHAAEYAGKVAADMKDKAVVVGWEVAHYTTEKAVERTKADVGVVQGVPGKAGETAAKPFVAAKDMTAATAEKVKTTREKEEAEREYEAQKHAEQLQHDQGVAVKAKEFVEGGAAEKARETAQGHRNIA